MKHKMRILSSVLLAAVMLLGQTALPAVGQVRASVPAALRLFTEGDGEGTTNPTGSWEITDPGLLYVGMGQVSLAIKEISAKPDSVTWKSGNEAVLKVDAETGKLNVTGLGEAVITASTATEYVEKKLYVPLEIKKENSYVYNGQPQGWGFVQNTDGDQLSFTYGNLAANTLPTDAGSYDVKVSLKTADASRPTYTAVSLGTFVLEPQTVENVQLDSSFQVPSVKQNSTKDVPADNVKLLSPEIQGTDQSAKIFAHGEFKYPDTSTPGNKNGGSVLLSNLSSEPKLNNYKFKDSYTIDGLNYKVEEAPDAVSIQVKTQPKLEYKENETLDLSALSVDLTVNGETKAVSFKDFGDTFTLSLPHGTRLTKDDSGKAITITHNASNTKATTNKLTVTAAEIAKVKPKLSIEVPSSGKAGSTVTVTVKFDKNGGTGEYPSPDAFLLTDNRTPSSTPKLGKGSQDGVYIAAYTLPPEKTSVKLSLSFTGSDSFESVGIDAKPIEVTTENPVPTLALNADKTSLAGGGDVTLTIKMTVPEGSPALPGADKLTITNDRGWTGKLNGSNGLYTAVCNLPNKVDTVTFTAAFNGTEEFSAAKAVTCTVGTTFTAYAKGSEVNAAIESLPTKVDVDQMRADRRSLIEQQLRVLIKNISQLSDREKRDIKAASLERLDELLAAVTGTEITKATIDSYYSSGSSSRVREGATVKGALAAADAGKGDKVALRIEQKRNGSSRTFLQVDLTLRKGTSAVSLATPVEVSIPLPSSYVKRSGVELRHRKSGGGYEYPSFSINGDRGNYVLSFRATSFSLYTLYLPEQDNGGWDDNETFDEYTITAKAGTGGIISPSGEVSVERGENKTFTVKAKTGYKVDQVLIDGTKKVSLKDGKYTFEEVTEPYTIEVTFKKTQTETASTPSVSSKPQTTSRAPVSTPTAPTTSKAQPAPASSKAVSSEPESSSEEVSSEPDSSEEESLPESAESASSEPTTPTGGDGSGGMTDTDLTVAVVIIIVVIALSLAAIFFGVYLSRKRDEEEDEADEEDDGEEK